LGIGNDSRGLRTSEDHKTVTDLLKNHFVGGDCLITSPAIGHSQTLRNAWKSPEIRFRRIFAPYSGSDLVGSGEWYGCQRVGWRGPLSQHKV